MFQCHVCGSTHAPEEQVNAAFQISGEPTFSRETTEKIRQLLHQPHLPVRSIQVEVFAFQ